MLTGAPGHWLRTKYSMYCIGNCVVNPLKVNKVSFFI